MINIIGVIVYDKGNGVIFREEKKITVSDTEAKYKLQRRLEKEYLLHDLVVGKGVESIDVAFITTDRKLFGSVPVPISHYRQEVMCEG
jgi:hypothetical protein